MLLPLSMQLFYTTSDTTVGCYHTAVPSYGDARGISASQEVMQYPSAKGRELLPRCRVNAGTGPR